MNLKLLLKIALVAYILMLTCMSQAHEVRPIFFGLEEIAGDHTKKEFSAVWKQPILSGKRLKVDPIFPDSCLAVNKKVDEIQADALIRQWQISCDSQAFQNGEIFIQGLSSTMIDVWMNVSLINGEQMSIVVRPSEPRVRLHLLKRNDLSAYLSLGIEHLLTGFDHILFVLGLMFFVKGFVSLLKTITAFAIAHSITLAGSSLSLISLPQGPVEASIALSILYLAFEASSPNRKKSLVFTRPWVVAFAFGLLHGFGFAGALREIGIPEETLWIALLLFNVGVEVGQILVLSVFFVLVYGSGFFLRKMPESLAKFSRMSPLYVMGSLSAYWFFQRLALLIE